MKPALFILWMDGWIPILTIIILPCSNPTDGVGDAWKRPYARILGLDHSSTTEINKTSIETRRLFLRLLLLIFSDCIGLYRIESCIIVSIDLGFRLGLNA